MRLHNAGRYRNIHRTFYYAFERFGFILAPREHYHLTGAEKRCQTHSEGAVGYVVAYAYVVCYYFACVVAKCYKTGFGIDESAGLVEADLSVGTYAE